MRTSAALALAVLAFAGCGGDEERAEPTITTPDLTVPGVTGTPEPTTTETAPAPAPPPTDTSGGAPAPPAQPDRPENDTPPESGSPEERFEKFCDANPGACG